MNERQFFAQKEMLLDPTALLEVDYTLNMLLFRTHHKLKGHNHLKGTPSHNYVQLHEVELM